MFSPSFDGWIAFCCSLGELNTQGLQIAIWAQNTYCQKLLNKCKDSIEKLQSNLKGVKQHKNYKHQSIPLEEKITGIQKSMNILGAYQQHINKSGKESPDGNYSITHEEISDSSHC